MLAAVALGTNMLTLKEGDDVSRTLRKQNKEWQLQTVV